MKRTLYGRRAAAWSVAAVAVLGTAGMVLHLGGCGSGKGVGDVMKGMGAVAGGVVGGRTGQLIQGGSAGVGQIAEGVSLSESDERGLGECVALQAVENYRIVDDDNLSRYMTMVAQTISDAGPVSGRPVAFVLDTDEVNAFSGPTGYIMITRGLLVRLSDESELAGVIAHETGHVVERHGLAAVRTSKVWQGLVTAGSAAAGRNEQLVGVGAEVANFTLRSSYNQGQENEADVDAVRYMVGAGYDPQGYVRALQKAESGSGGGFGKSHPATGDRIRNVQSEIARAGGQGGATNADRFQSYVRRLKR